MVIVLVRVVMVVLLFIAKVAQGQAGYLVQPVGAGLTVQQALQKTFQLGSDPVQTVSIGNLPAIGWAQCVIMRGGVGRQQHMGLSNTIQHRTGDQLQRFDGGQHLGCGSSQWKRQGKPAQQSKYKTGKHD